MPLHVLSLNPIQLSELTISEATEFVLEVVTAIIHYFKASLLPFNSNEGKQLDKFIVHLEWYLRSEVRIIANEKENLFPKFVIQSLNIHTLSVTTNQFKALTTDLDITNMNKIPINNLWEIVSLLVNGLCFYLKEKTPPRDKYRSEKFQGEIIQKLTSIQKYILPSVNPDKELDANFYNIKIEIEPTLKENILRNL